MTPEFDEEWRHWALATLPSDIPAAYPGGPSHEAGDGVCLSAVTKDGRGRVVSFTMPSPTALPLSISIRSAQTADELLRNLPFVKIVSPYEPADSIPFHAAIDRN